MIQKRKPPPSGGRQGRNVEPGKHHVLSPKISPEQARAFFVILQSGLVTFAATRQQLCEVVHG